MIIVGRYFPWSRGSSLPTKILTSYLVRSTRMSLKFTVSVLHELLLCSYSLPVLSVGLSWGLPVTTLLNSLFCCIMISYYVLTSIGTYRWLYLFIYHLHPPLFRGYALLRFIKYIYGGGSFSTQINERKFFISYLFPPTPEMLRLLTVCDKTGLPVLIVVTTIPYNCRTWNQCPTTLTVN